MSQKDNEILSTLEGNKPIDPKKLEKQKKFEEKQAKLAQQKLEQQQKQKKTIIEEKPKILVQEDEPMPKMTLEEALEFKRDLSKMKDKYDPKWVESHWYDFWIQKKYFSPSADDIVNNPDKKKFTILVPPPNVTGSLHIGHGLTFAIQDSIVRYYRMNGYITEYTPGTDHAGIATQTVVEKMLWKNEKKTRHDYGREAFLEKIWDWKQSYGERILMQSKRLGASVDWDRLYFTMDNNLTVAVKEAFTQLHEKGLIYRANRLVNWSCQMKTAISDIEVSKLEIPVPTYVSIPNHKEKVKFGVIISFAYKFENSDEEIVVATTRLETMLGDVAVAVNSKDERYKHLVGKYLLHPFVERRIPIITDDTLVDMTFGTGAVKITPAHDPNDFECGNRHKLQQITIFDDEGILNENAGEFKGMKRFECRALMIERMKEKGIYRGEANNPMVLNICERSKDVIEPMLRPQWYVNCQDIAKVMVEKVQTKELKIIPQEQEKLWFNWMGNIKDWCISRQIWWGHQCPAYQVSFEGESIEEREDRWIIARSREEAMEKATKKFNKIEAQITLKQDEDVLDTWFSSGLLPFSAFQWPNTNSMDFKAFFPNQVLETGGDILFFWVARMTMLSYLLCEKMPFHTVFLHPIIRDAQGRKMSKSIGNVIDPLEIIDGCTLQTLINKILEGNLDVNEQKKSILEKEQEFPNGIPEIGSDALRFSLLNYISTSQSINLDLKRVIGYRNFCNKIWQSYKFVSSRFESFTYQPDLINFNAVNLINRWILSKLNETIKDINVSFQTYALNDASNGFYQFWIYDFCDVYIESSKFIFQDDDKEQVQQTLNVLFYVIENGMRLLHPMMPFLSEELYQKLPQFKGKCESICKASYPQYNSEWSSQEVVDQFETIQQIVQKCRSMCSQVNLPVKVRPDVYFLTNNEFYQKQDLILKGMVKANKTSYVQQVEQIPKGCVVGNFKDIQIYISVVDHINILEEVSKLLKKIEQSSQMIEKQKKKLEIKDYDIKTPQDIKDQNTEKLKMLELDLSTLQQQIQDLKNI